MEPFTRNRILELPLNGVQEIRKICDLDNKERLEEAVDILEQWVQKQDHFLKKDFDRIYLEKSLVTCKGSVEKAKKKIDKLCTFKTLLPHFFSYNYINTELNSLRDLGALGAMLPKQTPDFYRIFFTKPHARMWTEKSYFQFFQYCCVVAEYLMAHDYTTGFIIVFDVRESNLTEMVTSLNLVRLQEFLSILMEGYKSRLQGMFHLTKSKTVDVLSNLIKKFLSTKLSTRSHVLRTLEDLHNFLPKDILPAEYGGKERPLKKLTDLWNEELSTEQNKELVKMMFAAGTIEHLRNSCQFNEEYMGTPGSFRHMRLD